MSELNKTINEPIEKVLSKQKTILDWNLSMQDKISQKQSDCLKRVAETANSIKYINHLKEPKISSINKEVELEKEKVKNKNNHKLQPKKTNIHKKGIIYNLFKLFK